MKRRTLVIHLPHDNRQPVTVQWHSTDHVTRDLCPHSAQMSRQNLAYLLSHLTYRGWCSVSESRQHTSTSLTIHALLADCGVSPARKQQLRDGNLRPELGDWLWVAETKGEGGFYLDTGMIGPLKVYRCLNFKGEVRSHLIDATTLARNW